MPNIADTIFNTGPKDELVTVDVYKDKGTTSTAEQKRERTSRELTSPEESFDRSDVEEGRNNSLDTETIVKAINSGLVGRNDEDLATRAKEALANSGVFGSLTPAMKEEVTEDLATPDGGNENYTGAVLSVIDGVERQMDRNKLKDATSVTRFLSELTGNRELGSVFDVESEMAVLNTVLKKSIELGITETIDIVMEQARDKKRAKETLILNLNSLAIASDLEGIEKVIGYIGRQEALARVPDLVQMITMFFRFPTDVNRNDYQTQLTRLLNALVTVDPDWDTYMRGEDEISNLTPFTYASRDAITLFKLDDNYIDVALLAPHYPSSRLINIARSNYPMSLV